MNSETINANPKVCIVTGGSSGIGLATAERFAKAGCRVVICGRDAGRLQSAAESLSTLAGEVASVTLDVGEPNAGRRLVEFALEQFGRVDVLVNNAGTAPLAPAHDMSDEDFEATLATNIRGVFGTSKAVWPIMKKQGGGAIVNVSSLSASDPFAGLGVYGASKAWVELYTQATAEEGREHNIRVFAVAPGAVDTPLLQGLFPDIPMEVRLGPGEVAELIGRLCDDEMTHVSGQSIAIRK